MKISFYTTPIVTFRGINESMRRVSEQLKGGNFPNTDTFTKAETDGSTIIIQNYNDNRTENPQRDISQYNSRNGAVDGAVTGVTTGGGIEGAKAVVRKVKDGKSAQNNDTQKVDDEFKEDDVNNSEDTSKPFDDEDIESDNIETHEQDIDTEQELDTETDFEPETDIEPDVDTDVDTDIDIDPDVEPDIDVDLSDGF
jgi:PREDICTED: hypothetical protein